ncbi:spore coat protein GerQ [Paenibacillus sp. GCM10012307]|uniref:Spore coat protein GerQ n=1 Tax=Paenibacillus roseus TaxID=2798579 RepID=A0A934MPP8_9BACL|nr:spore coat protein GerQ [Paenibacillus roseus]MBJ6362306.1 spore coat protein GerQ [Paenibacillus roseus]
MTHAYPFRNIQGNWGSPSYHGGYYSVPYTAPTVSPQSAAVPVAAQSSAPPLVPSGGVVTPSGGNIVTLPPVEESYVENILRLNRGKVATVYMTYENNREWNAKIFKGVILAAGRDHIILADPTTGMRYLLLTINLNYITFDEPINYQYPFQGGVITNQTPISTTNAPSQS